VKPQAARDESCHQPRTRRTVGTKSSFLLDPCRRRTVAATCSVTSQSAALLSTFSQRKPTAVAAETNLRVQPPLRHRCSCRLLMLTCCPRVIVIVIICTPYSFKPHNLVCGLLRRRSPLQRCYASMLSMCLSVCRQNPYINMRFSQKLSNLELWSLLTTYRKSYIRAFQRTHYWTLKIQAPSSWKSWNRDISTKYHQILMKFGTQRHI